MVVGSILQVVKKTVIPALSNLPTQSVSICKKYAEISSLALISVIIQAFFHNSSIFTLEPTSWVIMCIAIAWARILMEESKVIASKLNEQETK